jgi:hypothetical protein
MDNPAQLQQDLAFIKNAVEANRPRRLRSWTLWGMWAAIVFVGFALVDFAPRYTGPFWGVAWLVGVIVTWWRMRALGAARGVRSDESRIVMAHWFGMGAGQLLLLTLCDMPGEQKGVAAIVVVAIAYFYMGLHRMRPFLWFALVLALGAIAIRFAHFPYAWTCLGATLAASFLLTAALANRAAIVPAAA